MHTLKNRENSSIQVEKNRNGSAHVLAFGLVSLVVLLTVIAYWPVMFNFFLGDDFVHLTWLKEAVKHPELIWRNFHSSWLDGTTTRFYRPLISVFMVTDYLGWGINALGFHITNLLFHITATVGLFFTARFLLQDSRAGQSSKTSLAWLYPFGASLIFGLYPLHTEAVSWITGRVDAVVTAFYVTCFYSYLRWRKGGGAPWLAATAITFALGLLSKEMALTLPPTFILYEMLLGKNAVAKSGFAKTSLSNAIEWLVNVLKPTMFFWAMVAVYFGVRRYALGTFVGGYDDSLFFIADLKHFVLSWLHGLRMFVIPLNKGLMGAHHIVTQCWHVALVLVLSLTALNVWLERPLIRLFLFNCIFMAFCFAPVYKIFGIGDDLQGARLAHVATVALSLLLAMAFVIPQRRSLEAVRTNMLNPRSPLIRAALCLFFGALCMAGLWTNNQAWSTAGHEANAIRAGLSKLYENVEGDPQVLLLSLPDEINGSYICRNAVWGMTKHPQLQRDVWNCLHINRYEQIFPFGFLKESILEARDDVQIYSWDRSEKVFKPLSVQSESSGETVWHNSALKQILEPRTGETSWLPDGALQVKGSGSKPEVVIDFGKRSSFDIDFVAVSLRNLDTTGATVAGDGVDLLYTNDISPEFDLPNRTHADFVVNSEKQTVILPLRSLPEWALGGQSHKLILKLPRHCNLAIDSIEIINADRLMPRISFENSGYLGTKGYMHLSQKDRTAVVSVDASRVPAAAGVVLEVTRTNLLFELQNCATPSKVIMEGVEPHCTVSGDIELTRDMFKGAGMYEVRPWAVDKNGKRLGVAGDHIVVSVDS